VPVRPKRDPGDTASRELVARLSDEVKKGLVTRPAPKNRGLLLVAVALLLAGVAAFATFQAMRKSTSRASVPAETLPAGTEPVLPADLGTPAAGVPLTQPESSTEDQTAGTATTEDATPAPPEPAGPRNFEVHVASFNTDKQAKNLVKRLHDRGLLAWYAKATDQPNWYRVFVGHYATHAEAARQARSLLDRGLVEHAIAYPDHAR
jgi:cell division septation protein DedD